MGLAALAQSLGVFLAGAGHGWVTPFFLSAALWVLVPVTLYIVREKGLSARLVQLAILIIALGADAFLVRRTIGEGDALPFYVRVNGAAGVLIVGVWLCLWLVWQVMIVNALFAGRAGKGQRFVEEHGTE